jgi:hypothetical protein
MLLGIGAISVPIIIHLLNKRKFQRVKWAAMRFLKVSVQKNQRRIQIEDLLLLILRCVMVALIALALARPAIRSATAGLFGQAKVTAVIVVDNSFSMSQTDGVASRFDKAKKAAEEILDTLPNGSAASVWLVSDVVRPVIPEPTFDLNLARGAIRNARLSDRSSDLFAAVKQGVDQLDRAQSVRKELYVVTDGQRLSFRNVEAARALLDQHKDSVRGHVVLVTQPEDANLGVSGLIQSSGIAAVDRPLRFVASVTNYGSSEARDVRVALRVRGPNAVDAAAGADAPVDEATVDVIPPGATRSVSLFGRLSDEGYHAVTASIAPDRVPADDARTVVVRGVKRVKVLLVDGDPGREARDAETFYLRNALVPVSAAEASGYFVQATTISPAQLPSAALDDYDCVILANVTDFSPVTLDAFGGYLGRGGGLIVFPGANTQAAFYNSELVDKRAMLPASLGVPAGNADAEKPQFTLSDKDLEHPIAQLWRDPAAGSLSGVGFFRVFPLKPAPNPPPVPLNSDQPPRPEGEPRVVLRFNDGSPAVMERTWGQGRVILFASTADTAWNQLAVRPGIFVPLLYRCVGAVVTRQDEAMNVKAGGKFVLRPPTEWLGRDALITSPGGEQASRDTRRIELVNGLPVLSYDDTDRAGVYDVTIPDAPRLRFASQPAVEESTLDLITDADKQPLAAVATLTEYGQGASLAAVIEKSRTGTELWLPLVVLATAAAGAEMMLAQRFSRSK